MLQRLGRVVVVGPDIALAPPTRSVIRRLVARRLSRRVAAGIAGREANGRPYDVDGSATEYEAPPGRLER